jgi:hypothetical protein
MITVLSEISYTYFKDVNGADYNGNAVIPMAAEVLEPWSAATSIV